MRRGNVLVLTGLVALVAILGSVRKAAAQSITVNAPRDTAASSCDASCCPTNVTVNLDVNTETGAWSAQVNGVPAGGNPNNPQPIPANGNPPFTLRERKVIIRQVGQDPPTEVSARRPAAPPSATSSRTSSSPLPKTSWPSPWPRVPCTRHSAGS